MEPLKNWPSTDPAGGQQHHPGLVRALILEPSLLRLDEPLSDLDAKLREEMRFELKRLGRDLGMTAIHVTRAPRLHHACTTPATRFVADSVVNDRCTVATAYGDIRASCRIPIGADAAEHAVPEDLCASHPRRRSGVSVRRRRLHAACAEPPLEVGPARVVRRHPCRLLTGGFAGASRSLRNPRVRRSSGCGPGGSR
jgi:hypothetical protein